MYPPAPPPYQPPPYQQQPPSAGITRPNTVSLAAGLIMVVVFCEVVVAGMNVFILPRILSMYDTPGMSAAKTWGKAFYIGYQVIAVGVLVFFVFLAVAILRGRNWARITTFVLAGLGAFCCTCSGLSVLGGGLDVQNQQTGAQDIYPGWYQVTDGIVQAVVVLTLLAVIILLAVKPSGEFFAAVSGKNRNQPVPGYPQSGQQSGPPGYGYPPAGGGYPGGY
jgi:hypothetical protein